MRGSDSDTDHFLVKANLRTRIFTQITNKQPRVKKWDVTKLEERKRESQYQAELSNIFDILEYKASKKYRLLRK